MQREFLASDRQNDPATWWVGVVLSLMLALVFSVFFSSVLNFERHQNYPRPFVVKGKQFTELAFVLK